MRIFRITQIADMGAAENFQTIIGPDHHNITAAGEVGAVIAKTPEGTYTGYVGTRAIVLATGDFRDEEMVEKYCPWMLPLVKAGGGVYSGDGHKIALWAGGMAEDGA